MSTDTGEFPSRRAWLPPHFRVSDRRGRATAEKMDAQARWKSHWGPAVWASLVIAAVLHAALLFAPRDRQPGSSAVVRRGPVVAELIIPRLIDVALPTAAHLPATSPPPPLAGEARLFRDLLGDPVDRSETQIVLDIPIELPPPVEIREVLEPDLPPVPTFAAVADEWASYSRFAPSMVRPEILNQDEMRRFLNLRYARLVRTTGMQGTVILRFWIDENGKANRVEVNDSSGFKQLDDLALQLAEILRFSPAYQMGEAVRVFVELPISFQAI
jgi:TonB family protein